MTLERSLVGGGAKALALAAGAEAAEVDPEAVVDPEAMVDPEAVVDLEAVVDPEAA